VDPGAFVHPGDSVATIVDRATVRVTVEVPEIDFEYVAPGTLVRIRALANDRELAGTIARRSPAADPSTRTVHILKSTYRIPNDSSRRHDGPN